MRITHANNHRIRIVRIARALWELHGMTTVDLVGNHTYNRTEDVLMVLDSELYKLLRQRVPA